jgi:ParB family chromosome partitioning protein
MLDFGNDVSRLERELAELRSKPGRASPIQIASLRASPYHTGGIREDRVAALVENLRTNKLNSPIVVRRVAGSDCYETISGHHRTCAYTRLGRTEIDAVVTDLTDEEACSLVFFDNLLAPKQTAFELYLGFKMIRETLNLTHEAMATKAGLSRVYVTKVLTFDRLPPDAHKILMLKPDCLGATLAESLASHMPKHEARMVECIQMLADGKLKQSTAIRWLLRTEIERQQATRRTVKAGTRNFAEITSRGQTVTVRLADGVDPDGMNEAIYALLLVEAGKAKQAAPAKEARQS